MEDNKASWDNFHRAWIFGLIAMVAGCSGCSAFGGGEMSDEEFIEVVAESGCHLKTVKRDDGKVGDVACHDTVRVVHER